MPISNVTRVDTGKHKVSRRVVVKAPISEVFALVANPHRHQELDGSGTVKGTVTGPERLAEGEKFTIKMKMNGYPYRITSKVTEFADDKVIEWRHPAGHRWRWEFVAVTPTSTQVTETFDYSHAGAVGAKTYDLMRFPRANASGIRKTLTKLRDRFAR
ncbi:MAG: hypothetical protein JWM76_3758 [Pseudonocardiales bacterium]|nr:hypothetical protein [Pseudonocardiales bacterium]